MSDRMEQVVEKREAKMKQTEETLKCSEAESDMVAGVIGNVLR